MQPITFTTSKCLILHGHSNTPDPVLLDYTPPSKVWSAQPNVEDFDDAHAAITRAIELGVPALLTVEFWPRGQSLNLATKQLVDHGPIVEWTDSGAYPIAAVVTHNGQSWLHISDRQGPPDDVYDLTAGSGDWCPFLVKPEPTPPSPLAALEARLAALEAR